MVSISLLCKWYVHAWIKNMFCLCIDKLSVVAIYSFIFETNFLTLTDTLVSL